MTIQQTERARELAPCPWCAGLNIEPDEEQMFCVDCEAVGPRVSFGEPRDRNERWNLRATPQTSEEVVEAVARALLDEAQTLAKLVAERMGPDYGDGIWRSCSGCYETFEGQDCGHYPHSIIFNCKLGGGCSECGGIGAIWDTTDYEQMGRELAGDDAAIAAMPSIPQESDAEVTERIRSELINTPETADFMAAVPLEAIHQRERWGSEHDAGKTPFDWFWLVGYLAQKAASSAVAGDAEKAKHHTISTAAALANWHAQLSGKSDVMRPGIDPVQAQRDAFEAPTPPNDPEREQAA